MNIILSRNDPCWCESGKKYKKCHMSEDQNKKSVDERVVEKPTLLKKKNSLILDVSDQMKMREASSFNAQLMDFLRDQIKEGITTNSIDRLVYEYTMDHGHIPACLGYHDFPKSLCTSIDNVVCHGIPNDNELKDGQIVNIDLTTIVDGFHGDQSEMFLIGDVSQESKDLCKVAYDAMHIGIDAIEVGQPIGRIGEAIQRFVEPKGLSVVRSYQGHGIGKLFHQDPPVPHFKTREANMFLAEPGLCFTVEPMVNIGHHATVLDKKDGWTVRTKDGSLSAQWEHTILVTENGPEILTLCQGKPSVL